MGKAYLHLPHNAALAALYPLNTQTDYDLLIANRRPHEIAANPPAPHHVATPTCGALRWAGRDLDADGDEIRSSGW